MKVLHIFLVFSAMINCAFLALLIFQPGRSNEQLVQNTPITVLATIENTPPPNTPQLWSRIKTNDYEQLLKNLLSAGFPYQTAREIVTHAIRNHYIAKFRAVTGIDATKTYWISDLGTVDPQKVDGLQKLYREQNELLEKIFGHVNDPADENYIEFTKHRYGDLSDEKLQGVINIEQTYYKQPLGKTEEALKNYLTPDEYLEYRMRDNHAGRSLRSDAKFLNLTEEDFRAIFPAYQAKDDALTKLQDTFKQDSDLTDEQRDAYKALSAETEKQKLAQIRDIIGEDRYADYLQAKDRSHQKLNAIVQRLNLPLSSARAVVSVQSDITQRTAAIDSDTTLTPDQRTAQYKSLAQEAATRITQTLGDRGYAAYRENSKNWIQSLESGAAPK